MNEAKHLVTEKQVLQVTCPECKAPIMKPCRSMLNRNVPYATEENSPAFAFHESRIKEAHMQGTIRHFTDALNADEKALVLYYGFIMLCDSLESKSEQLLGKTYSSRELQTFFAGKAVEALKSEGLLRSKKAIAAIALN